MQLTRAADYALRAILDLALQPPETISLIREVAERQGIPEVYLAKLFQILSRAGLVKSYRGAKGGYVLARPAYQITLKEVIAAIEGEIALNRCLLSKETCSRQPRCPFHRVWKRVQDLILKELEGTTFAFLVKQLKSIH